jgi:hypothetical protein
MNEITQPPARVIHYDEEMLQNIAAAHKEAEASCLGTREAINDTILKRRRTGAMIHKFSRSHKQDLCGVMRDVMPADQVKAYMALHQAAEHRPEAHDKRQLVLCGIIDQQEGRGDAERQTAAKPSFVSSITKLGVVITKAVQDRPVSEWSTNEKEQIKAICAPIAKVLREIDNE